MLKKVVEQPDKKIVLLSGATGILGKAFAHELAEYMYRLTLFTNDQVKLNELKEELKAINFQSMLISNQRILISLLMY